MRQCLMKIDAIACVSAYTQSRLAQWFPPEVSRKAVTIPNAVEPLSGDADARELPEEGKPFVLCIAQHRQNKNVPLALRIFAAAVRARILPMDTRFLILGIDGPETRKIKKAIRAAPGKRGDADERDQRSAAPVVLSQLLTAAGAFFD